MKVEWLFLANYAEDRDGLLYISGCAWDTVNIQGPIQIEGGPQGIVGVLAGVLVARMTFNVTETGRAYPIELTVLDEDGNEVAKASGNVEVERNSGIPVNWPHGINVVIPLTGIPLRRFGQHRIDLMVGTEHKAEQPFRVLKLY